MDRIADWFRMDWDRELSKEEERVTGPMDWEPRCPCCNTGMRHLPSAADQIALIASSQGEDEILAQLTFVYGCLAGPHPNSILARDTLKEVLRKYRCLRTNPEDTRRSVEG